MLLPHRKFLRLTRGTFNNVLWGVSLMLLTGAAHAFDINTLNELLQRKAPDARAFVETQYRKVLKHPVEQRGELRFTPPDVFEKHITAPREQTFRITGNTMAIVMPGKAPRELSLRNQPLLGGLMRGFQAVVAGQLQSLQPLYQLDLQGDERAWTLMLTPKDAELAKHIAHIAVAGHADDLTRIEVLETSGDRSVTVLSTPEH